MTTTPTPSISVITPSGMAIGPWPTGWTYETVSDLWVYIVVDGVAQADLVDTVDYTVSGANPTVDGGNVTLVSSAIPESGWDPERHQLVIRRWTARRQKLALPDIEGHKPRATEQALDRAMRIAEEVTDHLDLALTVNPGETPPTAEQVAAAGALGLLRTDLTASNVPEDAQPSFRENIGLTVNYPKVLADGATDTRGGLADADGIGPQTLQPGLYYVGASLTFTHEVTVLSGARFVVPDGVVLTFNGLTAPEERIFDLSGGGAIQGLTESRIVWFAGHLINSYVAPARYLIQKAYDAAIFKGTVIWPAGDLLSDASAIGVYKGQHTVGQGDSVSWLVFAGTVMSGLTHGGVGDSRVTGLGMRFLSEAAIATDGVAFGADFGAANVRFIGVRTEGAYVAVAHKNVNGGGIDASHLSNSVLMSHHVRNAPNVVDSDTVGSAFTDMYDLSSTAGLIAGENLIWPGGTNMLITAILNGTRIKADTYNLPPANDSEVTGDQSGVTVTILARHAGHQDAAVVIEDLSEAYQSVNCQWAGGIRAMRTRSVSNAQGARPEHARFTNTYFDHSDLGVELDACAGFIFKGSWSAAKAGDGVTYKRAYNIEWDGTAKACWKDGHVITAASDSIKIRGTATGNNEGNDGGVGVRAKAGAKGFDIDIRSGDRFGFGGYQDYGVYLEDGALPAAPIRGDLRGNTIAPVYISPASFQAMIDALPSKGGDIDVPASDYSYLNPAALTVPLHKMVTWVDPSLSLPDGMPGAVWKSGFSQQPYEGQLGKASRPGDKFLWIKTAKHVPDPAQANQQDTMIMVEGHVPDTAGPLDHEYRGFAAIMASKSNQPNASIRAYHGTVVGDGGKAKLRSIRTASIGLNGHEGLVVGALHTAIRTGVIPASMGGNGVAEFTSGVAGPYSTQDAAVIGAVGPGIRYVFLAEGQEGAERPQTAFTQARGTTALLPEIAVLDLHGGGNGDILRVSADGTTGGGGVIARMNKDGRVYGRSYRSTDTGLVIADDAVGLITPPTTSGFFKFWVQNSSSNWGEIFFRSGAGSEANAASSPLGSTTTVGTQAVQLLGTTGVDGRVTVSVYQNQIQIENRSGASRNFGFMFVGL